MRARAMLLVATLALTACGVHQPTPELDPGRTEAEGNLAGGVPPAKSAVVYAELPCSDAPEVDKWARRFESRRYQWTRMLEHPRRGGQHLPTVKELFAESGLPPELAFLPAIESGFRANARGPRGSRGLWQFSAGTARRHGLVVHADRDDRLHVERSTRAAMDLLHRLHRRYGDWPLALAAYNAGEGRVDRARRDRPNASFWELAAARRLPRITRTYVPKFLGFVRFAGGGAGCRPTDAPTMAALH